LSGLLRAAIGVASIVVAAWLTLQWGILPRLDHWRPEIETWGSRSLGVPVRIGALSVRGDLWAPTVQVRDLQLLAPDGHPALQLADVEAVITPGSLLPRSLNDWRPHLRRLSLRGADLSVQRGDDGRWQVAGWVLADGDGSTARKSIDWLLRQGEVVIADSTLTYADARLGAKPTRLSDIALQWRNRLGQHQLTLTLTAPPQWGGPLRAELDLREPLLAAAGLWRSGDWARWRSEIKAQLPVAALQRAQALLPRSVTQGLSWQGGSGTLALVLHRDQGEWRSARIEADLRDLQLTPAEPGEPLHIAHLAGTLLAQIDAGSLQLQASSWQLQLAGVDAQAAAPPSAWSLHWARQRSAQSEHRLQADRLDLATLATLAPQFGASLPPAWRSWLAASQPVGSVRDLQLQWRAAAAATPIWRATGRLVGFGLQPGQPADSIGLPGLSPADLQFSANQAGGQAGLDLRNGWLAFPGLFDEPRLPVDRLHAELRWRLIADGTAATPAAVEIEVRRLQIDNADLRGDASGRWQVRLERPGVPSNSGPARAWAVWPGQLELQARVSQGDAARVHRYLPQVIPAQVRHYVRDAVRAGQLHDWQAQVNGALRDFPFADPARGRFEIGGQVRGVTLDYVPASLGLAGPAWPRLSQLDGGLRFEHQAMQIQQARARLADSGSGQTVLTGVDGGIANLADQPELRLAGQVAGPLDDLLHYVNHSPVGGWLAQSLAESSGSGAATVDLNLAIPLLDAERSRVTGRLAFNGNSLQIHPLAPRLNEVQGELTFNEQGFTLQPTRARALGGAVQLHGGMQVDQPVRLMAQGQASAEGLRQAAPGEEIAALARQVTGQTAYRLQIAIDRAGIRVDVDSALTGLALALPAPLGKTAEQSWPLRLQVDSPASPAGSLWKLRLADRLAAHWQTAAGGQVPVRGWLQVGEATRDATPELPGDGWRVSVADTRLSLDSWSQWFERHRPPASARPATLANGSAAARTDAADAADALAGLHDLKVRVGELDWRGRRFHQLDAQLTQTAGIDGAHWNGRIEARELAGNIELHLPQQPDQPAQVRARLTRLLLDRADAVAAAPAIEAAALPTPAEPLVTADPVARLSPLPSIDIEVEHFQLGPRPMGRLVLRAGHRSGASAGRGRGEWQIDQLTLQTADAKLSASGIWQTLPGTLGPQSATERAGSTRLDFKLALDDSGALLDQLGFPGTLKGGRGSLEGRIGWPGSPFDPSVRQLSGELRIALSAGQFLQADPGVARLLGILSLQSLPRRFLLDFRDLFQQGFGFDQIDGDVDMALGIARTRNLRMRGVQALVLTEGQADLNAETQDLHVWIVPNLDAGAASLAYAVINPAVGLGTLIGQMFLRQSLTEAATREFRVDGTWDTPSVTAISREQGRPVPHPASDPAEAAASQPATQP
jgi:uncharacterized protein (TIGR02099 family)